MRINIERKSIPACSNTGEVSPNGGLSPFQQIIRDLHAEAISLLTGGSAHVQMPVPQVVDPLRPGQANGDTGGVYIPLNLPVDDPPRRGVPKHGKTRLKK